MHIIAMLLLLFCSSLVCAVELPPQQRVPAIECPTDDQTEPEKSAGSAPTPVQIEQLMHQNASPRPTTLYRLSVVLLSRSTPGTAAAPVAFMSRLSPHSYSRSSAVNSSRTLDRSI
jgi:hypothetical protein